MKARFGYIVVVAAIAVALLSCDSRPEARVGVLIEPDGTMKLDGKEVSCDQLHAQLKGKASEEALSATCNEAEQMKLAQHSQP